MSVHKGNRHQKAFFDEKVFNFVVTAVSSFYKDLSVTNSVSMSNVFGVLKWALSPCLVFSTFGGMGGAATTAFKRLASLLAMY